MHHKITAILTGAMAAAALLGPGSAQAQGTVNIYNWNDYIGETTLEDFTEATGIETNYDVYDNLEILEQKLMVGNSGYDITVPTAEPTMSKLIQAGALQKLDKSKIPNFENLDPELMDQVAERTDPGNEYGVIYAWGTIGLGINPDKIEELAPDAPLDSFDLIFDPQWAEKIAPCGITILDSATDTIPTVLNYLGLDPNSEDPEDLARVEETLLAVRPHVKNFVTGQTINDLAGGDSCAVLGYSGDVIQAQARAEEVGSGVTIDYVTPEEGVQIWFDMLTIPTDAPNPDAAHAFINYVLDPEVTADITDYVNYGNAVPASLPLIDEAVRSNPAVFPPEEARANMFTVQAVSPRADRQRNRTWTRIKTGR